MVLFTIILIATSKLVWPEILEAVDGIDAAVQQLRLRWSAHRECTGLDHQYRRLLENQR